MQASRALLVLASVATLQLDLRADHLQKIWELDLRALIKHPENRDVLGSPVFAVRFSPDGKKSLLLRTPTGLNRR